MRINKLKLLSAVAAATLVAGAFSLLPGSVANAAPSSSRSITVSDPTKLQSAFDSVASGGTVKLSCRGAFDLADATFNIGSDTSKTKVTLDLGGCKVTSSADGSLFIVNAGSSLTIKNGGSITQTASDDGIMDATLFTVEQAVLDLQSGTFSTNGLIGIDVAGTDNAKAKSPVATISVESRATLSAGATGIFVGSPANGIVVNVSGTVSADQAISVSPGDAVPGPTINITGATIKGTLNGGGPAAWNISRSKVNITVDPQASLAGVKSTSTQGASPVVYQVSFNIDPNTKKAKPDPATPVTQYVFGGNLVGVPSVTRDGLIVDGWCTDPTCHNPFDFTQPVDAKANFGTKNTKVTLYPNWVSGATITFNLNGGVAADNTPLTQVVALGASPVFPQVALAGGQVTGWKDQNGAIWTDATTVTSYDAVTLTAQWGPGALPPDASTPGSSASSGGSVNITTGGSVATSSGLVGLAAMVLLICGGGVFVASRRRVAAH
ncbi:MAG: InlB B-repeat-containing protein [Propionibacteriaceae bacterium]|nr:InlB B-repeat-containing protein [Propionibacteriaceae bacterium]